MSSRDHRNAWHKWYNSTRWKRLREAQLRAHPLCKFCLEQRSLVVNAEVVDHIEPHNGNLTKFYTGKLQSLCKPCHDSTKRTIDIRGYSTAIGVDGWPLDPRHPVYGRR